MTLTLSWLRMCLTGTRTTAPMPELDLGQLSCRDIADLNLPGGVRARIEADAAHEQRRRTWL